MLERKHLFSALLVALLALAMFALPACGDDEGEDPDGNGGGDADVSVDTSVPETSDPDTGVDTNEPDLVDTNVEPDVMDTIEPPDVVDVEEVGEEIIEDVDVTDAADVTPGCGYGAITGRVCSPNGSDWLSDVEVSIAANDCDGNPIVIQDFTDADGFYNLENVPNGIHSLTIKTGSYTTSVDNVLVESNKTTDLTGALTKTCLDRRAASIAVLTGSFDHVEEILTSLGITHQLYEGDSAILNPNSARSGLDLLKNLNELLTYDIVFINCGGWYETFFRASDTEIQLMRQNLVTFVQSGGSIYTSDWAYFWAELAFPDAIDFAGDDAIEGDARQGDLHENLVANVLTPSFVQAVGADTMTIRFNWPAWVIAESVNFASTVHIMAPTVPVFGEDADLSNVPLLIGHKPSATSGSVYFTSFHHEAQLTSQMEEVLQFLVFQL